MHCVVREVSEVGRNELHFFADEFKTHAFAKALMQIVLGCFLHGLCIFGVFVFVWCNGLAF